MLHPPLDASPRPQRERLRTYSSAAALLIVAAGAWAAIRYHAQERAADSASIARTLAGVEKKLDDLTERQQSLDRRLGSLAEIVSARPRGDDRDPDSRPEQADGRADSSDRVMDALPKITGEEEPPSTERVAAEAAARDIIEHALEAGVWTDSDRNRVRPALASAGSETRAELVQQLAVAINNDQVRVSGQGIPF